MAQVKKLTPETTDKLAHAFSLGCTVVDACIYAEIGESTYHRWCNENEGMRERFKALQAKQVLKSRMVVANAIDGGDVTTAKWYLERKRKHEFSIKPEYETKKDEHQDPIQSKAKAYLGDLYDIDIDISKLDQE